MAGMSSRTKGPRNRELKRLQAEKPLFIQKRDKPAGSKVRKSKHHSPAGPSHGAVTSSRFSSADGKHSADGSKVTQQELAKMCAIRDWCKDSCSYYNPKELRSPPGAEPLERKVATCPHQGNKNVFSFMFCKPDCARSATDSVLSGRAFDRCNIKDNSSAPGSDEEQKATKHLEMTVDTSAPVCLSSIPKEHLLFDPPGSIW
ncbi:uncharacterized protein LOC133729421 isoform X2 [Rosa rugosa]|uniref:uncharacterized protein LOC133729421 isoform X2 n=1 Tax=Rosa rugosa TaxID=74645 RepID=UPI002B4111ED|nr:uncharacterized protein LOC133729421 isoform X2 [Rosa rugosa]